MWDYSIIVSLNTTVILFFLMRICYFTNLSALNRNKITFKLLLWFFANQVLVQIKDMTLTLFDTYYPEHGNLSICIITAVRMLVFNTAAYYQLLEWHTIGSLVKFQRSRPNTFTVEKDIFNKLEKSLQRRLKVAIILTAIY